MKLVPSLCFAVLIVILNHSSAIGSENLETEISEVVTIGVEPDVTDSSNGPLVPEGSPRFEFGVAAAGIQTPAYPASSVTSERLFVVPWFIYRSDKVQVKDGGIELVAYRSDRLVIDLGVSGSLNSDTSDTPLREGMPDLDFLFELGPRFNVPLSDFTRDGIRTRFNWVTSLRIALSTDFGSIDYQGPVLNTQLTYRSSGFFDNKLSFNAAVSTTWLGEELSDYFFEVDEQFVTPARAAFDARAGFLDVGISAGIGYKATPDITTFLGLGASSLNGSKNDDSPLFEDDINTRVILAASWRLFKSKRRVVNRDE